MKLYEGIPFKNNSGEIVPPGAIMEVTTYIHESGDVVLGIVKPTSAGIGVNPFVFNGPVEIPISGTGFAQQSPLIIALGNGTVSSNAIVGPVASQWYINTTGSGYKYWADDPSTSFTTAWIVSELGGGDGAWFMTPVGGIAARTGTDPGPYTPGVATCNRYEYYLDSGTRKIRSTTDSQSVYNGAPTAIGAAKLVQAKRIGGLWTVDVEPC